MKKLLFVLSLLFFSVTASTMYAAGTTPSCQPIYGGGQTCVQAGNILINKTVMNPQTNTFVDNLGVNDPKFAPDQTITFQIVVTNTGAQTLSKVTVRDVFPQFVSFVAGPGTFDSNTKTITFDLNDLAPNESRTFSFTGKIVPENQLPANEVTCVINQSSATADNLTSNDNAQFCIQKHIPSPAAPPITKGGLPVFPPTQAKGMPPTGPEALGLIALLPSGALGYFLRKRSIRV